MFDTKLDQEVAYSIQRAEDKLPNLYGLQLRDLFAMNALNGIIANGDFHGSEEQYAEQAYSFADAMLKTRRKQ